MICNTYVTAFVLSGKGLQVGYACRLHAKMSRNIPRCIKLISDLKPSQGVGV